MMYPVLDNVFALFTLLLVLATPPTSSTTATASFVVAPRRSTLGRSSAVIVASPPSSTSWVSSQHHLLHGTKNDRLARSHRKRTCLANASSASVASSTIAAGGALLLTSVSGILFEKNISKSGGGGHVITLLMAALLSNISQVLSRAKNVHIIPSFLTIPADHFLYDWCWSVFLPASLVFALLSSTTSSTTSSSSKVISTTAASSTKSNTLRNTILGMMLPFVAGSIGSIIGCITSFRFVPMSLCNDRSHHVSALLAGCLCASYIGGTVNFFATAKILKNEMAMGNGGAASDVAMGSAFGSMAAADLVVMAVYFAMLQTASRSLWLHRLFPSRGCGRGDGMKEGEVGKDKLAERTDSESNTVSEYDATNLISKNESSWASRASLTSAVVLSSSIALASVMVATRLEQKVTHSFPPPFNPPGTMCAFLALLGICFQRLVGYIITISSPNSNSGGDLLSMTSSATVSMQTIVARSLQMISQISPNLSNLCFYLLFAAVGTTADLSSAVAGGPMALAFASLALIIHSITAVSVTWFGTCLGKYMCGFIQPKKLGILKTIQWPRSSWEEVLTASNAAIGGPSTAAAFAVGLVPNKEANDGGVDRSQYRSALVIAATFWGVFGYAIATGIGVTVSKVLMHR